MIRILGLIARTFLLAFPLVFFCLPAPTSDFLSPLQGQLLVVASLYSLYVLMFLGAWVGRGRKNLADIVLPATGLAFLFLVALGFFQVNSLELRLLALCAVTGLVGIYHALEPLIRLRGLVSLLLFVAFCLSVELTLRALPVRSLAKWVSPIPPLAPNDRGNEILRKNGFRGQQPCKECSPKPIRVVAMGGSSTYGIPLPSAGQTFTAQLQRILESQRPGEKYEILNAGVAGYGIVQVVDSLEKYVVPFKPDFVIINSWFNDSAKSAGWYGYAGLSDREAQDRVEMFRAIENSRTYRFISHLRVYEIFRHYLLQLVRHKAQKRDHKADRRRMTPVEFKRELERIVELGRKHQFLPVFMYEVTNRQEDLQTALSKNAYYRAISEVASQAHVPLIDTITPFAARRADWLFSDFIHPNRDGHRLIAQTIFEQVFQGNNSPALKFVKPSPAPQRR